MVSYSKKILLVLIASALGTGHYAQAAERARAIMKEDQYPYADPPNLQQILARLEEIPPRETPHRLQKTRDTRDLPKPVLQPEVIALNNFLRTPIPLIDRKPENNPQHLAWLIEFDSNKALNYLLRRYPKLPQSPEKILESLAFANENHYKKAFLRIFNDFVKDKPLFMDSPKLVIKLFILSAQMGDAEAFVYLKNRLEKLKLTPDARNLIYLKAYDGLAGSNPGLAQQFLAEDIAQLSNRLND